MTLKDCYDRGLLRKRRPDKAKCLRAMELAHLDLERAGKLLRSEFFMESQLLSYTAMFQAARALLFRDGVFERSHACVAEYLREKYVKPHILEINFVNWLDDLRVVRHESLYGLDIVEDSSCEAEDSYDKASRFIEKVDMLLDTGK
jgi:uncharacterized protein (UPF0332 family)